MADPQEVQIPSQGVAERVQLPRDFSDRTDQPRIHMTNTIKGPEHTTDLYGEHLKDISPPLPTTLDQEAEGMDYPRPQPEDRPTGTEGTPQPDEITPPGQADIYTAKKLDNKEHRAADEFLKLSTGMGMHEWQARVVSGQLAENAKSWMDVVSNITKGLVEAHNKRHGVLTPQQSEALAGTAGMIAAMLYGQPGGLPKAGKVLESIGQGVKKLSAEAVDMAGRGALARESPGLARLFAQGVPTRESFKLAESPAAAGLKQTLKLKPEIAQGIWEHLQDPQTAPKEGFTRLYRAELPKGHGPYGTHFLPGEQERAMPQGLFYTSDKDAAALYKRDIPRSAERQINYIDLPTEEAEKYRLQEKDIFGLHPDLPEVSDEARLVNKIPQYIIPHSLGFRRTRLDEAGKINTAAAWLIARLALGAAGGSYFGDTMEEKVKNGAIGMGIALAPELIKGIAETARRGARLMGPNRRLPLPPMNTSAEEFAKAVDTPLTIGGRNLNVRWSQLAEDPEALDKAYRTVANMNKEALEAAKGGVQTDAIRKELAHALGYTDEDIMAHQIGTAVTAPEMEAMRQLVAASLERSMATFSQLRGIPIQTEAYAHVRQELTRQLGVAGLFVTKFNNMGTEAGRSLRAFGQMAEFENARQVLSAFASGRLPPESVAQALTQLPKPIQQGTFMRWLFTYGPQMASAAYVSALLTTGKAWIVKMASEFTAMNVMNIERGLNGFFDWARGVPIEQRVYGGREFLARYTGQLTAWREALDLAVQHMKDGKTMPFGEGAGLTAFERGAKGAGAPFPHAIEMFGKIANIPSRPLGADTAFFKVMNFRGELRALAEREGMSQYERGLIPRGQVASEVRKLYENPTERMVELAHDKANIATFTDPLVGMMAHLGKFQADHPMTRFIVPFMKISTNLTRFGFERTPILGAFAKRNRDILLYGTKSEVDEVLAKQAMGAMLTGAAIYLTQNGRLTGRGSINHNVRREEEIEHPQNSFEVGNTWYGIDRISEPLRGPIMLVANLASIAGEAKDNDWEQAALAVGLAIQEDFTSKTFLADLNTFMKAVMDQNPGAASALLKAGTNVIASGTVPPLVQQARRSGVGPEGSAIRELLPGDPLKRDAHTLLEHIKDRIPHLSSRLYPRVMLSGENAKYDSYWGPGIFSPVVMKVEKTDAVRQAIVKNQISVNLPNPIIFGKKEPAIGAVDWKVGIDLRQEPRWMYNYAKMAGNGLKVAGRHLERVFHEDDEPDLSLGLDETKGFSADKYYGMWDTLHLLLRTDAWKTASSGPHGGKAMMIDRIIRGFRKAARGVLIEGLPETQREEGADIQVPRGMEDGEPLLKQKLIEKELDKAGSLGGPEVRKDLERRLQERGMIK